MAKTLAQKSSYQLFLWGLLLVTFATVADSILNAVLFGEGSLQEQLLSPSYHELAIRFLFSTFILAAIYLGMHYLANSAQKESSLQQHNHDLDLVRQDLEEFQDDALRKLRNTSTQLETAIALLSHQNALDSEEKTRFFIENAGKISNRMNGLLEMSLLLTDLPVGQPHRGLVKLDDLAHDVVAELRGKHADRQVEFRIQPWISGWCDQRMIRQVIYNLFCNAMEFIPKSRQGCIEFGAFDRSSQKVLFVRDNGTGFSAAQAKRLFDPFREIAHDPDLPQDTLRLALARRIIHRHGGQIWAEGVQGVSGTVFFTYYSVQPHES